jgi:pimeloyl-ACP methyl ester carboxylesterase
VARNDLPPPRREGYIELDDGRRLGYAEYGRARGRAVLWFHGTPGASRQIAPEARRAAKDREVRLIAVERPGIGESTAHVYNAFVDWARDIRTLADRLKIDRFGVVGLSGGGPYALACAHEMPGRVVAAALLGSVAPSVGEDAASGGVLAITPWVSPVLRRLHAPLGALMRGVVLGLKPWADPATDLFLKLLPSGDRAVFADPAVRRMFHDDLIHGSRNDMRAMWLDMALFGRPWGFSLRDVHVPVSMWFGDADNIVPIEHAEHMQRLLPNSELVIRAEEGHLGGLGATHEILDEIFDAWDTAER